MRSGSATTFYTKVANTTQDELEKSMKKEAEKTGTRARLAGSLQRSIPILMMEQKLTGPGASTADAPREVQVLALVDAYETTISDTGARKLSPIQAEQVIVKSSGKRSLVVDAFVQAFGEYAKGAGA